MNSNLYIWRSAMCAEQKRAWLAVISAGVSLVLFAVLTAFFGAGVAMSAMALFAVNGFSGLIGRGEKADERDRSISRRATFVAAMCSYLGFYGACMGVWFVVFMYQGRQEFSVHAFPVIVLFAGLYLFWLVRSVAVLVLYGRHVEADNV
jgi:hypothetical protein